MVGEQISHYRIVSKLGAGGMGVVYEAEDVRLGRSVALKFLPDAMAEDRQALDRFEVEARAASALNHPNICTIHDIGEHQGRRFIVMELLKGQTLADRIGRGPMKLPEVIELGIQLADALDAAHHQGIMHRDIKPANVFITDRGQPKILDFGLAKLTLQRRDGLTPGAAEETRADTSPDHLTIPGLTLGTVAYMSPEQARGEELDARTDIFSLGVVLYEMVTGRPAFGGSATAVVFDSILNRPPIAPVRLNPDVSPRLEEVLNRALEKDRALRYQHASDLCADLKRLRRDSDSKRPSAVAVPAFSGAGTDISRGPAALESVPASPTVPAAASAGEFSGRKRSIFRMGLVAALLVALAAVLLFRGRARQEPTSQVATPPEASSPAPSPDVTADLAQASRSLAMRDFPGALAQAERVLRVDPRQSGSTPDRRRSGLDDGALRRCRGECEAAASIGKLTGSGEGGGRGGRDIALEPRDRGALRSALDPVRRGGEPSGCGRRASGRAGAPCGDCGPAACSRRRADGGAPSVSDHRAETAHNRICAAASASTSAADRIGTPATGGRTTARRDATLAAASRRGTETRAGHPQACGSRAAPSGSAGPESPVDVRAADERAIRQVLSTYERAIEQRDLALFQSVKPNLSGLEESRLRESFRAVRSQRVELQIQAIDLRDNQATVRMTRRDTIDADSRERTVESRQTIALVKTDGRWVITTIGG